jgi:hypothetical protein
VSWLRPLLLATVLSAGTAAASEPTPEKRASTPELSTEDKEVVENLELLESMDAVEDLELLIELGKDDSTADEE